MWWCFVQRRFLKASIPIFENNSSNFRSSLSNMKSCSAGCIFNDLRCRQTIIRNILTQNVYRCHKLGAEFEISCITATFTEEQKLNTLNGAMQANLGIPVTQFYKKNWLKWIIYTIRNWLSSCSLYCDTSCSLTPLCCTELQQRQLLPF